MTKEPRKYAEGTEVAPEKSRAELEALLDKHGATEVMVHRDAGKTTVMYRMRDRMIRQVIEYPDAAPFKKNAKGWQHSDDTVKKLREAEWRRRWRAQVLITKAKLEVIASGGSTFEHEFLAWMLLPNGETVGDAMLPRIAEAYETGEMPRLLLGSGA